MSLSRCCNVNTSSPAGYNLDMTVAADAAHWPQVLAALEALGDQLSWSAATASRVQLVAEEWTLNAMTYGRSASDTPGWVRLALKDAPHEVEIEFSDNGLPFDPVAVADKQLPDSLDEAHIGGLGLHLIRQLCSAMHYRREGSCNRLRVQLAKTSDHM